ncbi:cupin domain-containing protein [Pseudorhodoferax sp.]|uniref:cupin domain-containing protein n=1 Tax=Pseudorhodoferax sp. TaxID=1993553 RepID=UPI002DD6333F|nr:cupin domain-containing protein [Pseudorhodoferax sp.]
MDTQRAAVLRQALRLQPHPEGGDFREWFRSAAVVQPDGGRSQRSALTSIDFLLEHGQFSAWHRVASDEAWHLLEGGPLRLWLLPPDLSRLEQVDLAPVDTAGHAPRHVVPAQWWQAAEPLGAMAYVGATVGPGFEFADFSFGREDAAVRAALQHLPGGLERLL